MDDLVGKLGESLAVSTEDTDGFSTAQPHPRFELYKSTCRFETKYAQNKRRAEKLEEQKEKRFDAQMRARNLAFDSGDFEQDTTDDSLADCTNNDDLEEDMDISNPFDRRKRNKGNRRFKDQLMLSEWLVDIPCDLGSEWLMVPCPKGKRCIVVSANGTTKAFSKNGYTIRSFPSLLPGGSGKCGGEKFCLLDCVFAENESAFYILDLICWSGMPFYDSETDFRFHWVHSRIADDPGIQTIKKRNPYPFIPLPYCECKKDVISEFVMKHDYPFPSSDLDGLLFYHRKTHYAPGRTPLVGWLKPFMLPEILEIDVPDEYLKGHENRKTQEFIEDFNKTGSHFGKHSKESKDEVA